MPFVPSRPGSWPVMVAQAPGVSQPFCAGFLQPRGKRADQVAQDRRLAENRRCAQRAPAGGGMKPMRAALTVGLVLEILAAPLAVGAQVDVTVTTDYRGGDAYEASRTVPDRVRSRHRDAGDRGRDPRRGTGASRRRR